MEKPTETQIRIMDASLDLFSKYGIRSTTTKAIADKAGVNELTIFRNFGSKEKLLENMIDHHFDVDELASTIPGGPPGNIEQDLKELVDTLRNGLRQREGIFQLMLRESANETVAKKLRSFPDITKKYAVSRLGSIMEGRIRDDVDLETSALFLASYFIRSEMMRMMMGTDPFHEIDEEREEQAIDIFLNGALKEGGI